MNYFKQRYEAKKAAGICTKCPASVEAGVTQCASCRGKSCRITNAKRKEYKERVYAHYGNKCVCCGESERDFLAVDHVKEDGAEHRRTIGSGSHSLYRDLVKRGFPAGFQILCFNCNRGKHVNGGTCPHKMKGHK